MIRAKITWRAESLSTPPNPHYAHRAAADATMRTNKHSLAADMAVIDGAKGDYGFVVQALMWGAVLEIYGGMSAGEC
jgi:hypothetical protein